MELCVHGGEDWLFLDILCLQQAPHITMTTKYPLLAKSCDLGVQVGDMEGNLFTMFRPSVFLNPPTFLYPPMVK